MKRFIRILVCILLFLCTGLQSVHAYFVTYKEQYYRLYHIHYNQYPDDTIENIYWLERAINADFCNPLYAETKIENETEWEKYRYLFNMHLNLKMAEQHLRLGSKWDKQKAYFYNAPWKEQNLDSLKTAETCYEAARNYWHEAQIWAEKAGQKKFSFLHLTGIQNWEDESFRIKEKQLNYDKIIDRQLKRLNAVRQNFEKMDEHTY